MVGKLLITNCAINKSKARCISEECIKVVITYGYSFFMLLFNRGGSMVHGIDTHRMIEKALQMQPSTVQFVDLMVDEEKEKYNNMNRVEMDAVRWKFTEELIKRKLDRKIALSVKLGDDTVYIKP